MRVGKRFGGWSRSEARLACQSEQDGQAWQRTYTGHAPGHARGNAHLVVPLALAFASAPGGLALCFMLSPSSGELAAPDSVPPSDTRMVILGGGGGEGGGGGGTGGGGGGGSGAGAAAGATAAANAGSELAASAGTGVAAGSGAASQGSGALPDGAGTDGGWAAGRGEGDGLLGATARKMRCQKFSPAFVLAAAFSAPLSRRDSTRKQPAASRVTRNTSGSMRTQLPPPLIMAPGNAPIAPFATPLTRRRIAAADESAPRPPWPQPPRRWCAGIDVLWD